MYRVRVVWTGPTVAGGGLSTFYMLDLGGGEAAAVDGVGDFLDAIDANLVNTLTWSTEPDVDTIDPVTGALTGSSSVTPRSGAGGNIDQPLPLATQGLLRMRTGFIVAGRELKGRLFVPGFCENNNSSGGPDSGTRFNIDTASDALIARTDTSWAVWSRTHGQASAVTAAPMWNKWAVLRSRRD